MNLLHNSASVNISMIIFNANKIKISCAVILIFGVEVTVLHCTWGTLKFYVALCNWSYHLIHFILYISYVYLTYNILNFNNINLRTTSHDTYKQITL